MKNPKKLGDQHVKSVYEALVRNILNESIDAYPKTVLDTVRYITTNYPNIHSVDSKFNNKQPDRAKDILLYLDDKSVVTINLFLIRKGGRIQPKNPGAKSFFEKYFLSKSLQEIFNGVFENKYIEFLKEIIEKKDGVHYIADKRELKKLVLSYFRKFTEEINPIRDKFLYGLREECFLLLKEFYNQKNRGFFHAYNVFFMTEDLNIITSYGSREEDVTVYEFNPGTPSFKDIEIYKTGKSTVGIKYGEVGLTLRFKFESNPTSSIKLASSYEQFPNVSDTSAINSGTVNKIIKLMDIHTYTKTSNSSNAIGKCHEALTYFSFINEYPHISQVDPDDCVDLMGKYYSQVNPEVLQNLYKSTSTIVPVISEKLDAKYSTYKIESIELVPDSYMTDKLNTGDLQLILRVSGDYVVENISLKALARRGNKLTTKNPGIGTILGPDFFNVGTLEPIVNEVKSKFQVGEITRTESLEVLSTEIGHHLKEATQEQLKKGVENLLGKCIMAVTFYEEDVSYCKEHTKINGPINVYVKKPTAIQNTLSWNNNFEMISLRVKFSRGKQHGWSTIKLTSEYQLK